MKQTMDAIREKLLQSFDCEAIVLFGSYARGTQTEKSDIDIAIKTKNIINRKDLFLIKQELEDICKKDIDLVDLNNIGDGFRYEILINGQTLYCKNQMNFELYKLEMFREFLELNESRMPIIERVKNGGNIYG